LFLAKFPKLFLARSEVFNTVADLLKESNSFIAGMPDSYKLLRSSRNLESISFLDDPLSWFSQRG